MANHSADDRMSSVTLQPLLDAVRRRLRVQRLAQSLRIAAWVAIAVTVACLLVHWFVRPLGLATMLEIAALPSGVALAWAVSRRNPSAECAAWADRHLGGASAYSTWLELTADRQPAPTSPAVERLSQWIDEVVPHSLAGLRARPLRARLTQPVVACLTVVVLAAVLLQLPVRHATTAVTGSSGRTQASGPTADADARSARENAGAELMSEPTAGGRLDAPHRSADLPGPVSTRGTAQDVPGTAMTLQDSSLETSARAGGTSGRAGAGGHEAGDSPDTSTDAGLSDSWQGALAEKLRATGPAGAGAPERADPSRLAEYDGARGPPDTASIAADLSPAPALAPEPQARVQLGPTEQAYVRAYFAGSGAAP